ncbi:hypothetical protein DBR36_17085 [Microbacterium sp. HMWF026]|uniref:hypothetical protein n=1 Tax=Microbacterium sp. HMWF026 TaxID=2056861 RepID=UPI000D37FE6D|nr:hypothetical protein [Microbacterium sp. HMWF026]PTT13472.1 hypothetical protein DBR36_17085 [Microbacterium sp. HMWF026]
MSIDTPPPAPPRRRGAAFAISIVTIVAGGFIALGTFLGTGLSAAHGMASSRWDATVGDQVSSAAESGTLSSLDVQVAGARLSIVSGDVEAPELDAATSGPNAWTLERDGDHLRVVSPTGSFIDPDSRATLTLPRGSSVDADVRVSGGALDVQGDFDALDLEVSGGSATVSGTARSVDLSLAGGSASVDLTDASTAAFDVAGGRLTAALAGTTPEATRVEVTAGSADVTLPDDEYAVTTDDGVGTVDNALRTSPDATAQVDVTATMGRVTLRS